MPPTPIVVDDFKESDKFLTECRLISPMESQMLSPRDGFQRYMLGDTAVNAVIESRGADAAVDYVFRMKVVSAWRALICLTNNDGTKLLIPTATRDSAIELLAMGVSTLNVEDPMVGCTLTRQCRPLILGIHNPTIGNIWRVACPFDASTMNSDELALRFYSGAWANKPRLLVFHSTSHLEKSHGKANRSTQEG